MSVKAAFAIWLTLFTSPLFAENRPIYDINPAVDGDFVEPANNKTWGSGFYVTSPVRVTYLGWYDTDGDGLSNSHRVGIWTDSRYVGEGPTDTLLTSATIPAGTAAELSGPWRRVPITPITLQPGGYAMGGQNNSQSLDKMWYIHSLDLPSSVVDPRIRVGSFDYNVSGPDGFNPPGSSPSGWYALNGAEVGAMIFVEAIPEPSTVLLTSLASAASVVFRRRRQI